MTTLTTPADMFQKRLADFKSQKPEPVAEKPAVPQIDFDETLREQQADIQRATNDAHAKQRLNEWAAGGLEETDANFNLIKDFVLNSAAKGYWSREIVDAAVANLGPRGSNQLTWRKAESVAPPQPAPAEPAEPQEVLEPLPNGESRLPLDVDNRTLSRASKEQAKDWLARANAGKLLRPRGGFGSKF
jgi:hypothetical protein